MEFLYHIQLSERYRQQENWDNAANATIGAHFKFLSDLHAQGIVKFVGKTDLGIEHPDNIGLAIFEAVDESAARELMQQDPAVQSGLMHMKILPFRSILK